MEKSEVDVNSSTQYNHYNCWYNQMLDFLIPILNRFVRFAVIFVIEKIPFHFCNILMLQRSVERDKQKIKVYFPCIKIL